MTGSVRRGLVVAHATVADVVPEALVASGQAAARADVLVIGSAARAVALPPGTRRLLLPGARGAPAFVVALRRRGYTDAVIVWPYLAKAPLRGAVRGIAVASGASRITELDVAIGSAPRTAPIPRRGAVADASAWSALTLLSGGFGLAFAAALRLAANRSAPRPAPGGDGPALYLRTDLDLATASGPPAGGAAAHTAGIVGALARRRPVRVATTGPVGVEECIRLPVWAPPNVTGEVAELVSGLVQAVVLLRRAERPALIYQRYSLNNLAGAIAAARWRVPLVLEANASEAGWRRHWGTLRIGPLADAAERLLLRRADRIVAVSTVVARDLVAAGAPPERVVVAPNAVDPERFDGAAAAALPFPEDAFVVAFAGSFYPWHGVEFLAEAFVRLVRERPASRLLLVGDGATRSTALAVLAAAGVADAVHWTGLVDRERVPGLLAAADVLVSPHAAWRDFIGSPIKVFEYMAAGRAIVATRVGQIGEVLRDRDTALVVEPSDPGALLAALRELHDDPDLRMRLGRAAGLEARERHSWDARVAAILADR